MRYLCDNNQKALERCKKLDNMFEEFKVRLCYICQCISPPMSKHCYYCDRCCLEYDHHCVFLFTCIGKGNINKFIAFTGSMAFTGFFGCIVAIVQAIDDYHHQTLSYRYIYSTLSPFDLSYLVWNFWFMLFDQMTYFHFVNVIFCLQFTVIGIALCFTTVLKKKYLTKIAKKQKLWNISCSNNNKMVRFDDDNLITLIVPSSYSSASSSSSSSY